MPSNEELRFYGVVLAMTMMLGQGHQQVMVSLVIEKYVRLNYPIPYLPYLVRVIMAFILVQYLKPMPKAVPEIQNTPLWFKKYQL